MIEDDGCFMAGEPAVSEYAWAEQRPIPLVNYDKIDGVGPQSVEELLSDLKEAERDLKSSDQWGSLDGFLAEFKQSHAAWLK